MQQQYYQTLTFFFLSVSDTIYQTDTGGMPERLNGPVSKTGLTAMLTWVRIPLPPHSEYCYPLLILRTYFLIATPLKILYCYNNSSIFGG